MKTYILDPISDEALKYAQSKLNVITWNNDEIHNIENAEAIIVRTYKVTKNFIDKMPKLRIIAKHGVGIDNIDISYANKKGILVTNTPTANSNAVAELIIGLILNCARKITASHLACLNGLEKNQPLFLSGYELTGKKLGLIGVGNIGSIVGHKLKNGFDMTVLAYDPFLGKEKINSMGFDYTEKPKDIYTTCDIISISVPLTPQTKNMIDKQEFAMFKSNTILINASRGGIVNEEALNQALEKKLIFGAAIDAFIEEPVSKNNPLFQQFNFIGNPHNGANTKEALNRMGIGAVDEIVRVMNNKPTLTNIHY